MEVNPLSIILVMSDSKGDRLLFRYPFNVQEANEPSSMKRKNPYTLPNVEDLLQSPSQPCSNIYKGHLTGFPDEVLSSLFAVKPELCNDKFELKVNDVRFVSHPTKLQRWNKQEQDASGVMLINIVFALQALASQSVGKYCVYLYLWPANRKKLVTCYHGLSKRMGIALRYEEKRCGYVTEQTQTMAATHDDGYANTTDAAFETILKKCTLANNMKKLYEDLCTSGLVNIRVNKWITLSFCLPQKVHQWHLRGKIVEPKDIDRCLKALRPYHSLLLLYPVQQMSDFLSLDGSPALARMLSQYSPLKNLQTLAADADLTLNHVFELTAHLVYWAKATVIFPICSTNKYVISPDAPVHLNSHLVDKFVEFFPHNNLIRSISEFALPTSLSQKCNPLGHPSQETNLVQHVIWMLQHHLLLQLHTYIQYIPTDHGPSTSREKKQKQPVLSYSNKNGMATNSYPPSISENTKTESESGASTISEAPDTARSDMDLVNRNSNHDNMNFTSSIESDKQNYQEELLLDFPDEERGNIFLIPATNNPEDLKLFAKLCRKGYFHGQHHIEEIMYLENLRRSQLLQLLDKFRDVLITYETEDSAIAMFYYS